VNLTKRKAFQFDFPEHVN